MKTLDTGLLKGRITRRSLLAAAFPAAGLSLTANGLAEQRWECHKHYRLGGAWIGADNAGFMINHVQIPLDPAGKTAALLVQSLTYGPDVVVLLALLGADSASDFVGQIAMISPDKAKATIVGQLQKSGNPPVNKAISVVSGIFQFTGPDTVVGNYTTSVYPPSADGLPHGDPAMGPFPAPTLNFKRVPLL